MTQYQDKRFSVVPNQSKAYEENYARIFGEKVPPGMMVCIGGPKDGTVVRRPTSRYLEFPIVGEGFALYEVKGARAEFISAENDPRFK